MSAQHLGGRPVPAQVVADPLVSTPIRRLASGFAPPHRLRGVPADWARTSRGLLWAQRTGAAGRGCLRSTQGATVGWPQSRVKPAEGTRNSKISWESVTRDLIKVSD